MTLSSQLLFFFSALGAFNGIVLSAYFSLLKPSHLANKFIALLLLMISLRVGKSVCFYFYPDLAKHYLQLGLSACFLIGPMLYFYCVYAINKQQNINTSDRWHIAILLSVIIIFGYVYPYQSNVTVWAEAYKVINLSWLLYIVASLKVSWPILSALFNNKQTLQADHVLLVNVLLGTSVLWGAYFTASYTSYISGALSFSFSLYLSIIVFLRHMKSVKSQKYTDKKITEDTATPLIEQLNHLMNEEKLYRDANLTLPQLAQRLRISVPQLSQLLNDNLSQSFNHFVNEKRINEAKALLTLENNINMEMVAEKVGYNSLSTFYSAFKKFEQTTPAKYRKLHFQNS